MQQVGLLKYLSRLACAVLLFALPTFVFAQTAGTMDYITASSNMQFFDGSEWQVMGGSTTLGACSTAGQWDYDSSNATFSYCNGTNWISMTVTDTGVSCSAAGEMQYDTTLNTYKFCNGTNYITAAAIVATQGYFVLSSGTYTGDMGGTASANASCLSDLTSSSWNGKSTAQAFGMLNSDQVKAFLCESASCLEMEADTTYEFARAGSATDGGATFTTDSSGFGPGDSNNWSGASYFGVAADIHLNRGTTSATLWSNTPNNASRSCTEWTSSGGVGEKGDTNQTNASRWDENFTSCASSLRIICVVLKEANDTTADPFSFTDLTAQTQGATVTSNIVQMTGYTGTLLATFSSSDWTNDTYEAQVCSDSGCSSVVTTWTDVTDGSISVDVDNYLQLRRTVAGNIGTTKTITVNLGGQTDDWSITSSFAGDDIPDSLSFTDLTNQASNTLVVSNIIQITGIVAADITGNGTSASTSPHNYRICADAACSTVLQDWDNQRRTINNNEYLQLRTTTADNAGSIIEGDIYVGTTLSDNWSVETTADTSLGAFVMISGSRYTGTGVGSLATADATCLSQLTANNFPGKSNVTLSASTVKAFLCDSSTCNNLAASTTYIMGTTGNGGGAQTFTTNVSGQGPNDSNTWNNTDAGFSAATITGYWTGRAAGTSTLWSTSPSGSNCTDWTSNSSGDTGTHGRSFASNSDRWSIGTGDCDEDKYLVCFVDPTPTPTLANGYFVLSSTTFNGDMNGRGGANYQCLNELKTQDWNGKTDAENAGALIADHVFAFLCDDTNCLEFPASKTYNFAKAGDATAGGASFTTDASGFGPGNADNWSGATYFNATNNYWTGRSTSAATLWDNDPYASSTCTGWTTSLGNAGRGRANDTDDDRWGQIIDPCSAFKRVICVVDEDARDATPNAFSFTNATGQTQATLVTSNIVEITGFTEDVAMTFSDPNNALSLGDPEYQICSDSGCSSVVTSWTSASGAIAPVTSGQYIQVRRYSSGNLGETIQLDVTIGGASTGWTITTSLSGDDTPNAINFADVINQPTGSAIVSTIEQLTGVTAADISGPGAKGSFEPFLVRSCSDASCASVVQDWTQDAFTASNNHYLQLQSPYFNADGTQLTTTINIGSSSDSWTAGTTINSSIGAFVLIDHKTYDGDDLGSLAGADAECLTELTNNNFSGQSNVTISASTVKAFLCDDTSCNNLQASTEYMYATTEGLSFGGNTFTTDGSGNGPNTSTNWSGATRFSSGSNKYWTGRAQFGTGSVWPATDANNSCSNWSSTAGTGQTGIGNNSNQSRWFEASDSCSDSFRLICIVDP